MLQSQAILVWAISAIAVAGVIVRPFGIGEWIFAVAGAAVLVVAGLLSPALALQGIRAGTDVYLFLAGMMLLAELARREGLFAWLAARAARAAKGSPKRLFLLVYAVGTVVTIFLSNDATAVVLTPAVAAVALAARAPTPLPYLLICAFVANAASFVLPISNPANLVVFDAHMPALGEWLMRFGPASAVSIVATLAALYATQARNLGTRIESEVAVPELERGGRIAAIGLVAAAIVLLAASAIGLDLGLPTALAGLATVVAVLLVERKSPWPVVRHVGWDTLVLVAGLFVIVRALEATGLQALMAQALERHAAAAPTWTAAIVGFGAGVATNLTNNLPLGLIGGATVATAHVPKTVTDAVLIGIDLGPNLSVTGSLATIIWLTALRREGITFGAMAFLRIGVVVMPVALVSALGVRVLVG